MLAGVEFFVFVGFAAQMVDGALGMAYGVTATAILLSYGVAPAVASASVHTAEVFTTAASGAAHWRMGNVERALLWRLAAPGVAGGVLGSVVLTSFPGDKVRPFVAVYILAAGIIVLTRGLRAVPAELSLNGRHTMACGLIAGFLDAAGGGGWGLLVTSSLLFGGLSPRKAIGTACLAEFFVTTAISMTFLLTIGLELWPVILGLIIGGVLAAPIAAHAARRIPERPMMIVVGSVVIALSLRELLRGAGLV